MKPEDTTAPSQSETLSFAFELPHPPEKVWRALTDPALVAEWLLPIFDFKLEVGAQFRFQTQAFPGWDGTVRCRVLEIDPLRKLEFAWVVGEMVLDTTVTFSLTPTPTGTRLNLVQTGFKPDQKQNFGGARYGWRTMGGRLVELLARIN